MLYKPCPGDPEKADINSQTGKSPTMKSCPDSREDCAVSLSLGISCIRCPGRCTASQVKPGLAVCYRIAYTPIPTYTLRIGDDEIKDV